MSDEVPGKDRRRNGVLGWLRRHVFRSRARVRDVRVRKVEIDPDIVMATLFIMVLLLGAGVGFILYQQNTLRTQQNTLGTQQGEISSNQRRLDATQAKLARLEKRDRITSYQSAYRFCTRESIDRAAIHWFLTRPLLLSVPKPLADEVLKQSRIDIKRMRRMDGMPILDCGPNVAGQPAKYMSPKKQIRFMKRWRDHELTPAEIGICRIRIGALTDPGRCLKP